MRHAAKVVQDIKMMRSAVVVRDKEKAERATLVAQEKLIQGVCACATRLMVREFHGTWYQWLLFLTNCVIFL